MITEVRERLDVGGCPNTKRNKEREANNRPPQHRAVATVHCQIIEAAPNRRIPRLFVGPRCWPISEFEGQERLHLLRLRKQKRPGAFHKAFCGSSALHKVSARRRPFAFCFLPNDYDCNTQENLRTVSSFDISKHAKASP